MVNIYEEQVNELFKSSGMIFSKEELKNIEYADFGLGQIEIEGLNLIIYINNDRYCAKEMVLIPNQVCPEHRHPNRNDIPGKKETFRCRQGEVFLFVEGEDNEMVSNVKIPEGKKILHCKKKE